MIIVSYWPEPEAHGALKTVAVSLRVFEDTPNGCLNSSR